MYRIPGSTKRNPALRWSLPDSIFFACGACHVLAYAFLERYGPVGLKALWIKPAAGFTGNHIFVAADEGWAFDYHGYSCRQRLLDHAHHKAGRWWLGWTASLIELPPDVLVPLHSRFDRLSISRIEPGQVGVVHLDSDAPSRAGLA